MMFSGWRAAVLLVAGLLVLSVLLTVVFWIGVLLAVLLAVGWLNFLLLPRVARRTRLPELALAVALLPLLGALGFAVAGLTGLVESAVIWTLGVALPRVALWRLGRQLSYDSRTRDLHVTRVRVIDAKYT